MRHTTTSIPHDTTRRNGLPRDDPRSHDTWPRFGNFGNPDHRLTLRTMWAVAQYYLWQVITKLLLGVIYIAVIAEGFRQLIPLLGQRLWKIPGLSFLHDYEATYRLDLAWFFAFFMLLAVMDRYFRNRSDPNDRLVIAKISGSDRALLWQGSPVQLRREFPTATAFRDFLLQQSAIDGSLVNTGVANVVDYVSSLPNVAQGKARSAVFVLSDMQDTGHDPAVTSQRLDHVLADYAQTGGRIGMYYVDQALVPDWNRRLRLAGVNSFCVECEIVGRPTLPTFD